MNAGEMTARLAIHDLVHSYAVLLDTGKMDQLAQLFTADAVLNDNYGESDPGRDGVVAYLLAAINVPLPADSPRPKFMRHNITTHRVQMTDPSTAKADTYFVAVTDTQPDHWGRYRDKIVHTEDGWRFDHRAIFVEGWAESSWYAVRAAAGESARE